MMKNNYVLALILGLVTLPSLATISQCAQAFDNTNPSQVVNLGKPFLVEHYQTTPEEPETANTSISADFTGEGIINDTVNISAQGNGSETFRNNDTSYIQGKSKYVTENKDIATYDFYAIGNYNPDGSFDSNGIAIFDEGATGELSFLSNSVGIYKDLVDKNGTGTFLMWHWR
ncbi:MAG: hypothetical protein P0116_10745 [Candidatus Nitrosocosmicus sp.]|nr:hypothetical protein [Candidatus Nitrosocosmicus sp.]